MESFSLYELNQYVRRVIALNFPEAIWVHAEITQISESRGNYYLDLIEKEASSEKILAQSAAIIWYRSFLFLKKKLKDSLDDLLQEGIQIKIKVKVEYHERYGLKLSIEDIDPSYTLGKLELRRQEILQRLEKEQLLNRNQEIDLPPVLQKIAVISSSSAAGYKDFMAQLKENAYSYVFDCSLFETAVQGKNVSNEISKALVEITDDIDHFDCIVIIRGGGSKVDLSAFDDYNIGLKIATCKLPVITGIGHEIDQSVTDIVAHTALKTPTAVANFIIDRALEFESKIYALGQELRHTFRLKVRGELLNVSKYMGEFISAANARIKTEALNIEHLYNQIWTITHQHFNTARRQLDHYEQIVQLTDPSINLKRGFSITRKADGTLLKTINDVKVRERIQIEIIDGKIDSNIQEITKNEKS